MARHGSFSSLVFWVAALASCSDDRGQPALDGTTGPQGGGQTGAETGDPYCSELTRVARDLADETPSGFSAAEALNLLSEPIAGSWHWTGGGLSGATVRVERGEGPISWIDLERDHDLKIEIFVQCDDVLSIPVRLSIATDDGRLDETWLLELRATTPSEGSIFGPVSLDGFGGTFDPSEVALEANEALTLAAAFEFEAEQFSGGLEGYAESEAQATGDSPDAVVSSPRRIRIGDFTATDP